MARAKVGYFVQAVMLEFTEDVVNRMESLNISKRELARKLDVSPAYITKMLGGQTNFTLESMVKVSQALDCELRVHLQPKGVSSCWFDIIETQSHNPVKPEEVQTWFAACSAVSHARISPKAVVCPPKGLSIFAGHTSVEVPCMDVAARRIKIIANVTDPKPILKNEQPFALAA